MRKASVAMAAVAGTVTIASLMACSAEKGPRRSGVSSLSGDEMSPVNPAVTGGEPGAACDGMSPMTDCLPASMMASTTPSGSTEGPPGVVGISAPAAPPAGGDTPAAEPPPVIGDLPPPTVACDESTVPRNSPNQLGIDVNAAEQAVHKEIFGVLMETLGRDVNGGLFVGRDSPIPNTNGLRDDIVQGFIEAGVGIVQWPGGCAANNYNWQANINPLNTMGTDLFMEFTQRIGAEPYITGRPNAANAASNRAWVEYINNNPDHPEWNLKYFKVGNEVWGCGGNQVQATYEANYEANYAVLSPPVNGKELFIVAGTDLIGRNNHAWLDTMIPNLGGRMNGVEIHDYIYFPDSIPNVGFSDDQYYNVVHRANQGQIGPRLDQLIAIMDRRDPEKNIKIMEDEWGDWLIGFNEGQDTWLQQGTVMDAISAGEQLHLFMAHADRILMAAIAQPINVIHSLFLTRASDGVLVKTPTFYVFKMFAVHHSANARWAPNTLTSQNIQGNGASFPVLSSGATVDDAGAVNISLVNVDLVNSRSVDVTLNASTTEYVLSRAQIITGAAKDTYNDFAQPESVNIQALDPANVQACGRSLSINVPSKSIVMLRLEPAQ